MIEIKNLSFKYDDQKILKNINFKILDNQWISIMGHNGSGKSTLAKILVGLLESTEGNILIDKLVLNSENLSFIRSKIGMIFQNPDYQFIGQTVKDDIAFGLENQNLSKDEIIKRIYHYSSIIGINDILDRSPQELSGGQKQKVAIASILSMKPEIIIFDEVTAFLDNKSSQEIKNIIKNIKNKILITITHDLDFALQSDEIIVFSKGEIVKKSKPEIIFDDYMFLNKYNIEPTLALKLYHDLKRNMSESDLKNKQKIKLMKEALWQYSLKK